MNMTAPDTDIGEDTIFDKVEEALEEGIGEPISGWKIKIEKEWILKRNRFFILLQEKLLLTVKLVFYVSLLILITNIFLFLASGTFLALGSWIDPPFSTWYANNISFWIFMIFAFVISLMFVCYWIEKSLLPKMKPIHWHNEDLQIPIDSELKFPKEIQDLIMSLNTISESNDLEYGEKNGNVNLYIEKSLNNKYVILFAEVGGWEAVGKEKNWLRWVVRRYYLYFGKI